MLEIPESKIISKQVDNELVGKTIRRVINGNSPHRFTYYHGDPLQYGKLLEGKQIVSSTALGMFVDIHCEDNTTISFGDGTNLRYYSADKAQPKKHQLVIMFDDASFTSFTVSMYGSILVYQGTLDNPYHQGAMAKISPLDDAFDENYLDFLFKNETKNISSKALLATGQRIPGLGNGVLQDILFNARIHPKRKIWSISDFEKGELFHSIKITLAQMSDKGGRNTEKDMYGNAGKYQTILSAKTYKEPCINCGNTIIKEAYLGGSVYYCPTCQKL